MSGLLCAGNVQIGLLNDDGTFKGFMPVKNTVQCEIANGDSNEKTRQSKMIASYGQALDTVYTPGAYTLNLGLDDHDADVAGMAFRGAVADITVAAQNAQTATVPLAAGLYMPIKDNAYNLSNVSVKDPDDETKTFTLGTDYLLDAESGLILKLAGGGMGETAAVTFSAGAYTASEVTPGTKPTVLARIWGRMQNLANGKSIFLNVPKVALFPSSNVDWLADSFAVSSFSGTIQVVNGQPPFTARYVK